MSELTDGAVALADVHAKVCEYHNLDPSQVAAPTEGVLATWNMASPWANAGWHYWTDANQLPVLESFLVDQNIHLVNEAFSPVPSWAEGAIVLADQLLEGLYGITPPHAPLEYSARSYVSEDWDDAPQSMARMICENTCTIDGEDRGLASIFASNGMCSDGVDGYQAVCDPGTDCDDCGARPASGGSGGDVAEDPACFFGDSRLLLANGSRIALSMAEVPDRTRAHVFR